ncbi:hypothetical protein [Pedobacter jamesrossensis]|uniref:Uncharacterized protein n=1 Tax=Pedobacter jamesrossensis TaxID=1908238 RepID=A0ABV8NJE5_9SPHI
MQISVVNNLENIKSVLQVFVTTKQVCVAKLKANDIGEFRALYKFYAPAIFGAISRNVADTKKCNAILEKPY